MFYVKYIQKGVEQHEFIISGKNIEVTPGLKEAIEQS